MPKALLKQRLLPFCALLIVVLVFALVYRTGTVPQFVFGHDIPVQLEGSWRAFQGLRPHTDFNSPVGAFPFLVGGFALKVFGVSTDSFAKMNAVLFLILLGWSWTLTRRRVPAALAFLIALCIGLTTVGPYPLSFKYTELSSAMTYNRLCFSFLMLLVVEVCSPVVTGPSFLFGVSNGLLLALLFMTKFTFLLPAVPLVLLGGLLKKRDKDWWLGVAFGGALTTFLFFAYLRFTFVPFYKDFFNVAQSRSSMLDFSHRDLRSILNQMMERNGWVNPGKILEMLRTDIWQLGLIAVFATAQLILLKDKIELQTRTWKNLILVLLTLIGSYCVILTSAQWGENPAAVLSAVVIFLSFENLSLHPFEKGLQSTLHLICCLILFCFAGKHILSLLYTYTWKKHEGPRVPISLRIQNSKSLSNLFVIGAGGQCSHPYGARLSDGIKLVQDNSTLDKTLVSFDAANPFSLALELPVPHQAPLYWTYPLTFDLRNFVKAEKAFRDVDLVLIPKCPEDIRTTSVLQTIYGGYLSRTFSQSAESPYWVLLKRIGPKKHQIEQ